MTTSGPAYAVTCYTCQTKVWEGDTPPANGQTLLTTWANANCKRKDCRSTTAAIAKGLLNG